VLAIRSEAVLLGGVDAVAAIVLGGLAKVPAVVNTVY
jgi:hypothetical protein